MMLVINGLYDYPSNDSISASLAFFVLAIKDDPFQVVAFVLTKL
jgi:hypothetical protein